MPICRALALVFAESNLHVAKFFLVLVLGTMICICKFTNMLHCYTCLCQEDRKEQSQGSAESSDPKVCMVP